MTDAQTEARAIVPDREHYNAADKIWRLSVVECKHAIATALAAKDAELAAVRSERDAIVTAAVNRGLTLEAELAELREADGNFWEAIARAERAEAQLTETNKALEDWWVGMRPSGWSRDRHAENPHVNLSRDGEKALADIAARRAREAQGGENG